MSEDRNKMVEGFWDQMVTSKPATPFAGYRAGFEVGVAWATGQQSRSICDITCPKCGKPFTLRWDPPAGVPETLHLSACASAGVYDVRIECPSCGHAEEVES